MLYTLLSLRKKWKSVGLALRLPPSILDEIEASYSDSESCFSQVIHLWLREAYNSVRFGPPTWGRIVEAVAHPAGGNDQALAAVIAERYTGILLGAYVLHPKSS